ncbi:MAG TPA: Gfo/Idh/MocA family oxidoreductase [Candidatus Dormibacteraeota bacterium]|nr:Gfo/Idh/MocA family oxidoreductase [Candidatus Dormibacteraeota bacterium]
MIRVGIVGYGHWGPNYARVLAERLPGAEFVATADLSARRLAAARAEHPEIKIYADHLAMVEDRSLDAIIISTPTTTHRALTEDFLNAGVHVMVEKPMFSSSADARAMGELAARKGLTLMVGHTFLYNPAVRAIKKYLNEGTLGNVLYMYFTRTGLGPIREDVNALWDLAPHDLSMIQYWLAGDPVDLTVQGQSYLRSGTEDVAFLNLRYPNGVLASIHVSWLDPIKVRRATIVGDQRMVVFDDTHPTEKLRLYDKGASYQPSRGEFGEFVASVRDGDILIPKIDGTEPLRAQLLHFLDCIRTGGVPMTGWQEGEFTIRILERAQAQLDSRSKESSAPHTPPGMQAIAIP